MKFSSPFESPGLDNDAKIISLFELSYGNLGIEADNT